MSGRGLVGDEYWMSCPFCGDSPRRNHFSVRLSLTKLGVYHCFRCGASGRLTGEQLWSFRRRESSTSVRNPPDLVTLVNSLIPGPGNSRDSALERYHLSVPGWDAFLMRDPRGRVTGVHLRQVKEKVSRSIGQRSLGYPGKSLMLRDLPFLRLVEGPYDVLYPEDVCSFGLPSQLQMRFLRSYPLVFCPDGDLWMKTREMERLLRLFVSRVPYFLGVERLPPGKDPDEVPREERKFWSRSEIEKENFRWKI